jgi:hypothetical protein
MRSQPPNLAFQLTAEWLSIDEIDQQIRDGVLENGTLLAAWMLFRLNYPR